MCFMFLNFKIGTLKYILIASKVFVICYATVFPAHSHVYPNQFLVLSMKKNKHIVEHFLLVLYKLDTLIFG